MENNKTANIVNGVTHVWQGRILLGTVTKTLAGWIAKRRDGGFQVAHSRTQALRFFGVSV